MPAYEFSAFVRVYAETEKDAVAVVRDMDGQRYIGNPYVVSIDSYDPDIDEGHAAASAYLAEFAPQVAASGKFLTSQDGEDGR